MTLILILSLQADDKSRSVWSSVRDVDDPLHLLHILRADDEVRVEDLLVLQLLSLVPGTSPWGRETGRLAAPGLPKFCLPLTQEYLPAIHGVLVRFLGVESENVRFVGAAFQVVEMLKSRVIFRSTFFYN